MNINRHNYEELFLMYVDNELTPEQRTAVERFVIQNPDLANELQKLQQATLIPEEALQFTGKELLYKQDTSINLVNCEAYFLLYLDDELSLKERNAVEKFVLQHPQVQPSFTLLQSTQLKPETIEFKYKESLYRKEERRIIPLRWMRMAAAAAILGAVTLLYNVIPFNNKVLDNPATVAQQKTKPSSTANTNQNAPQKASTVKKAVAENTIAKQLPEKPKAEVLKATKPIEQNKSNQNTGTANLFAKTINRPKRNLKNTTASELNIKPQQKFNIKLAEEFALNKLNTEPSNSQKIKNNQPSLNPIAENNTMALAKNAINQDVEFHQTIYSEIDVNNEDDNTIFFGSARLNKNKMRGLLKKATSLFDKRADRTEENN